MRYVRTYSITVDQSDNFQTPEFTHEDYSHISIPNRLTMLQNYFMLSDQMLAKKIHRAVDFVIADSEATTYIYHPEHLDIETVLSYCFLYQTSADWILTGKPFFKRYPKYICCDNTGNCDITAYSSTIGYTLERYRERYNRQCGYTRSYYKYHTIPGISRYKVRKAETAPNASGQSLLTIMYLANVYSVSVDQIIIPTNAGVIFDTSDDNHWDPHTTTKWYRENILNYTTETAEDDISKVIKLINDPSECVLPPEKAKEFTKMLQTISKGIHDKYPKE